MSCDLTAPPAVDHVMSCDLSPSCSDHVMSCDITEPLAVDHVMSCDITEGSLLLKLLCCLLL